MTGHKIRLPKTTTIKDGKITVVKIYPNASARIAAKKSKKVRVGKKV